MKHLLVTALLLLLGLGCGGPLEGDADDGEVDGPTLYLDHCARCHGIDARGTDTGPDLYYRADGMSTDEVADVVVLGEGLMSPVDLDDAEAEAVADFLLGSLLQL